MNAISIIAPYKYLGMWVFDDEKVGLVQEPFVGDADQIIDRVVKGIPNAEAGFILLFSSTLQEVNMAQLVVRNLSDDLVKALKRRAAKHNRSAEQEHREILEAALREPKRRSLASVLASMPNVGRDEDFVRQ